MLLGWLNRTALSSISRDIDIGTLSFQSGVDDLTFTSWMKITDGFLSAVSISGSQFFIKNSLS